MLLNLLKFPVEILSSSGLELSCNLGQYGPRYYKRECKQVRNFMASGKYMQSVHSEGKALHAWKFDVKVPL